MGNSSSAAVRSIGWLRFALVVLVCLAFGLVLGYSATPAVRWLGKQIAVAETSRSAVVSPASRRTESDLPAKAVSVSPSERLPLMPLVGQVCDAACWSPWKARQATSATDSLTSSDEGHLSPTLRAGPNAQDSRSGRPVQADKLRALSSVRTGTHPGEYWESKTHWDYCGNPQCRLCYPVAGPLSRRETPLTSDTGLPDMPQGYCKRHPQSRDCKPIVVPAPKPLPKATDPPVVASAGLGEFSRETLAWTLVCVFFVAWLVSGLELSRSKQSLRVSDRLLGRREIEASEVRQIVQSWLDKQGHDRCWYYPEIFTELARVLDLRGVKPSQLPTLAEFKAGCERYQREQYLEAVLSTMRAGNVTLKPQDPTYEHLSHETVIPEAARCDPSDLCSLHKPCAKHEPFPPEYLGLSIERDRLSLRAQQQFQTLASATSSMSLHKAQAQPTNSDERGTDST